jgi:hypothetical protein
VGVDNRTKSQLGDKPRLQPGVYAIVEILGSAEPRQASADPFWIEEPPVDEDGFAVEIKYLKNLLYAPVLFEDVKGDSQMTDKYLLKGFQASSMPLDKSTFDRILSHVGADSQIFSNIETRIQVVSATLARVGKLR